MLHTENQLPRLPQTALIVMIPGVVVWCGFLTDYKTSPTKVVLSCFGLLDGLWQYVGPHNHWYSHPHQHSTSQLTTLDNLIQKLKYI